MSDLLTWLTLVSLTASGIIGGTFFIFSTTIMRSLAARPANEAIETMNEINTVIVRTLFIAVFLGNAAASAVLMVAGLLDADRPGSWLMIGGAAAYLLGSFLVTIVFNVPRNNALAAISAKDPDVATPVWNAYLTEWTRWNHVRTVACILSTVLLAGSLVYID
jgi:uncharacterized membrane protein